MNSTNGSMISIVRKLIKSGNAEQMKAIFTLPLSRPYLNELVVYSIYTGDIGVIDEFVKQKVSLDTPPPSITKGSNDDKDVVELIENYKETPYIIFATITGKIKTLECLLTHQRKLSEVGHIGYSPKKHNSILSNCLGAAAFYGHKHIVDWISTSYPSEFSDMMNYKSTEKLSSSKISKLSNECNGYTPLQLCVVGADNLSLFIELLTTFQTQCNCKDSKGNNLIHLCVIYNKIEYLKYLIEKFATKSVIDINDRNSDGVTAQTLAYDQKDQKLIECFAFVSPDTSCQQAYDDLIKMDDEVSKKKEKKKKKSKKDAAVSAAQNTNQTKDKAINGEQEEKREEEKQVKKSKKKDIFKYKGYNARTINQKNTLDPSQDDSPKENSDKGKEEQAKPFAEDNKEKEAAQKKMEEDKKKEYEESVKKEQMLVVKMQELSNTVKLATQRNEELKAKVKLQEEHKQEIIKKKEEIAAAKTKTEVLKNELPMIITERENYAKDINNLKVKISEEKTYMFTKEKTKNIIIQHEKVQRDSKLVADKLVALKTKEALFQRQKDIEKQSAQDAEDIIALTNSQLESLNIIAKASAGPLNEEDIRWLPKELLQDIKLRLTQTLQPLEK